MAAPTFQAEGTISASATTTPAAITIPTHRAGDILLLSAFAWMPDPVAAVDQIPTPAGWTLVTAQVQVPAGTADGWSAMFWKRAADAGTTVSLTAGANWTSGGTTSCIAARCDVIRGAKQTGTPFEGAATTGPHTSSNQNFPDVAVTDVDRLGMIYGIATDNLGLMTGTGLSGASPAWTVSAATASSVGTDASIKVAYREIDSTFSAIASTTVNPAQGGYWFYALSFLPEPDITYPTFSVVDAFTRTEDPAATGWAGPTFTGRQQGETNGTQLRNTDAGATEWASHYTTLGTLTDCEVYATVVTADGGGFFYELLARCDGTNSGYALQFSVSGGWTEFYAITNGTYSANLLSGSPAAVGVGCKIGLQLIDDEIKVFQSYGGEFFQSGDTITNSAFTSGYPGLGGYGANGRWDDFGTGSLAAGGAARGLLLGVA